ncbi:MAG: DivIVA domain-containing protein [Clostridiales bacterium]|nr:DivIVA domain-containing protein [Candidatus Coliplasma caballi]
MLAPHELKNKSFTKTLKGYNPAEVDEYIAFLLDKYAEAYKENNELDHKLRVVVTNLDEIKDEEESIRSTLISAQKMAQNIIADANEKADVITGAVKDRCDAVIAEFKEQLRAEKEEMWELRTRIVDFKKQLFDQYRDHLQAIKDASVNEIDEIVLPNEDAVVTQIFKDVKQGIEDGTHDDEDDGLEIRPVGLHFSAEDAPELTGEAAEAEDEYLRYMLEGNENVKGAQNGESENADAEE